MAKTIHTTVESNDLGQGSLRNHFLIAMPSLQDPIFAHTITYVCEHSVEGAMGIVINHPLNLSLGEIFELLKLPSDTTSMGGQTVLSGGPVQIERGFVLHPAGQRWESTVEISPEVSLTASRDIIVDLAAGKGPASALVALGYAGWSAGQLETEIAANAWLTVPADSHVIFDTPIEQRWTAAARHLGIDLNLISSCAGHA
ncbi:MAG: YqgE/AlgH family protein [Exilibacterium sp.]